MRLLNVYTREFEEFFENDIPPYYILSHRVSVLFRSYTYNVQAASDELCSGAKKKFRTRNIVTAAASIGRAIVR